MIDTTHKLDIAIYQIADQISGSIHLLHPSIITAIGIGNKLGSRQITIIDVTSTHTVTSDIKLSYHFCWDHPLLSIKHKQAGIWECTSNRHSDHLLKRRFETIEGDYVR